MTDPITQLTASSVIVFLLQWLKNSSWFPWISQQTGRLNRVLAALLAAGTAVGIHATFEHGTLTIAGLTLTGVLLTGWTWLKSFAVQEMIYLSAVKRNGVPSAPALKR